MIDEMTGWLDQLFRDPLSGDDATIEALWRGVVEPLVADMAAVLEPSLALAFLAGGLAMASGARLALLAALLHVGAELAVAQGLLQEAPAWLIPMAAIMLAVGIVQGLLTLVAGEQTAGSLLVAAVPAIALFILWRGPLKALRLVLLLTKRLGGR